jgi:NADPH:quinone reductase-like Zn-dependent oxidoreductase
MQVAKAFGAEVAATVRDDNKAEFAKKLGADLVINTRQEDFVQQVKDWTGDLGADVVIDNLGGDVLAKSIEAAKPRGVIVAYGFAAGPQVGFDIRQLFFTEKKLRGSMASDIEDLQYGLQLIKEGRVKSLLDRTLPLNQAAEAHRLIAGNQVTGNIVLLPWAE